MGVTDPKGMSAFVKDSVANYAEMMGPLTQGMTMVPAKDRKHKGVTISGVSYAFDAKKFAGGMAGGQGAFMELMFKRMITEWALTGNLYVYTVGAAGRIVN